MPHRLSTARGNRPGSVGGRRARANQRPAADGNRRDLLVNEIGSYDGTVRLGSDALVLEIAADGDWTVAPQ